MVAVGEWRLEKMEDRGDMHWNSKCVVLSVVVLSGVDRGERGSLDGFDVGGSDRVP
jgi:hypothetical protein